MAFSISFESGFFFVSNKNDRSYPFQYFAAWAWVRRTEWLELCALFCLSSNASEFNERYQGKAVCSYSPLNVMVSLI